MLPPEYSHLKLLLQTVDIVKTKDTILGYRRLQCTYKRNYEVYPSSSCDVSIRRT